MKVVRSISEFRSHSIADQVEEVLRTAIREGSLRDPLPGEHQLAKELGVSRSSLRIAMSNLASDGLIVRSNGRRARLNDFQAGRHRKSPPTVCIICSNSRENFSHNMHPIVLELRADLIAKGIHWREIFDASLDRGNPGARIKEIVTNRRHVCWLLFGCSPPVLHWFSEAKLPSFILGSCPPGVTLASVDFDYRAVGWHAAGQLSKHGHKRIALVQPQRLLTGDTDARNGFHDYISKRSPTIKVITISAEHEQTNLGAKIDQHLSSSNPPTAFFALHVPDALRTYLHLLKAGNRIPEDISVVSRDSIDLFDIAAPDITRYRGSISQFRNRAIRIAQALLNGHPVPAKPSLVTPTFISGRTLGPA